MLIELADPRIDLGGSELWPGQLIQRGDDADVRRVGEVGATQHLGEFADVAGPDVAGSGFQWHHEGEVCRWDPLGEQAYLWVGAPTGLFRVDLATLP